MFVNPRTGNALDAIGGSLVDPKSAERIPVIDGIPRFVGKENYAQSFDFQWNRFVQTQIDSEKNRSSSKRFWAETDWVPHALSESKVLEVGSGAGRFTNVVMHETKAILASIDYSGAVEANLENNGSFAKEGRLKLAQASIYEIPFPNNYFEKVFCFGVLQHTPDFRKSLFSLYEKLKPGGELVVDFYPINGWWTKLHSKYFLRPITKRMPHRYLLRTIRIIAPAMIVASKVLNGVGLGVLTRFLPVCDIKNTLPRNLNYKELKEHVILDAFDMFSPAYDNPQRISTVVEWLKEAGAEIGFAGFVHFDNFSAAVVRCAKPE